MRAVVYDGPGSFAVEDVAEAELGVCGTDHHIHDGGVRSSFPVDAGTRDGRRDHRSARKCYGLGARRQGGCGQCSHLRPLRNA